MSIMGFRESRLSRSRMSVLPRDGDTSMYSESSSNEGLIRKIGVLEE